MSTVENTEAFDRIGLRQETKKKETEEDFGQQTFMKLMVATMNNQDPTDPVKSTEYLSQMASFSTASGIDELNKSFAKFTGGFNAGQALNAAELVGRKVMVGGSKGYLDKEGPLAGAVSLKNSTTSLQVKITDKTGQAVRTLNLGSQSAGRIDFSWDGLNSSGERLPAGQYNVSASEMSDGKMKSASTAVVVPVESVLINSNNEVSLNTKGIGKIKLSGVIEIL